MGFNEQAIQALKRRETRGAWHCIECWSVASDLTSPEDKIKLGALARTFTTTSDPVSDMGGCGRCHARNVRVVRSLEAN